jgi:hypothetical protein
MPSATEPAWLNYDIGLAIRLIGLVQTGLSRANSEASEGYPPDRLDLPYTFTYRGECLRTWSLPMQRRLLIEPNPALVLIASIQADLDRLRGLVQPRPPELDPKDPRNKTADGKLTPRGEEICYRMFDAGKTRYAVHEAMEISFGAANYRFERWQKIGGSSRSKKSLSGL